jgi:hypothetical protein
MKALRLLSDRHRLKFVRSLGTGFVAVAGSVNAIRRSVVPTLLCALTACAADRVPEAVRVVGEGGDCSIVLAPVAVLTGDDVDFGVVRMSETNIYLENRNRVLVFDHSGHLIREFGREGKGPGEYSNIAGMVPLADGHLTIFDMSLMRLTFVDSLGTPLYTAPLPLNVDIAAIAALSDTTFVLGGRMVGRERFGQPLVVVDAAGTVLGYYGDNEAEKEGRQRGRMMPRLVAATSDGVVISLPRYRYSLEVWDRDGKLNKTIDRESEWFYYPPKENIGDPHLAGPPVNQLVGLQLDTQSRAWVLGHSTPADWARGIKDGRIIDYDAWIDSRIEIIDLYSSTVLCSVPISQYLMFGFPRENHVASFSYDVNHNPIITLWKLQLHGL